MNTRRMSFMSVTERMYATKMASMIAASQRLYSAGWSKVPGISKIRPVRKLGKKTKSPMASASPSTSENAVRMCMGLSLKVFATHLSNFVGSA